MLREMRRMLVFLALLLISSAYAQDGNGSLEQKPTEEKQGGEYSGFEESQEQSSGLPNQEANPTPQAPISGLDVQQEENSTSTAATAAEPSSPYGMTLLAGIGAVAAGAIVAATWYFRKGRSR